MFNKNFKNYLTVLSMLISFSLSIIIVWAFVVEFDHYMNQQINESANTSLRQSVSIIQRNLDSTKNIVKNASGNIDIHDTLVSLKDKNNSAYDKYEASRHLKEHLLLLTSENSVIEDIMIITPTGQFSAKNYVLTYKLLGASLPNYRDLSTILTYEKFFNQVRLKEGVIIDAKSDNTQLLKNKLFFATNIYDSKAEFLGIMITTLDHRKLYENLLLQERYSLSIDEDEIYKGNDFNEEKSIIQTIYPYNLNIQYRLPDKVDLFKEKQFYFILVLLASIFLITFLIISRVSIQMLSPLDDLMQWIKSYIYYGDKAIDHQKKNKYSLRERIFFFLMLTTLFPTLMVSVVFYKETSNLIIKQVRQNEIEEIKAKSILVNEELERLKRILPILSLNYKNGSFSEGNLQEYMETLLGMNEFGGIQIAILDALGQVIYSTTENLEQVDLNQFTKLDEQLEYQFGIVKNEHEEALFSVILPIKNHQKYMEHHKFLMINLEKNRLLQLPVVEQITAEKILFENNEWNILPQDMAGNYEQVTIPLIQTNMSYQVSFSLELMKANVFNIFWSRSFIFIIIILGLILLSYLISNRLMVPFEVILQQTHKIPDYNHHLIRNIQIDEIELLRQQFIDRVTELNQALEDKLSAEKNVLRMEFEKKEIQLFAIQNQVNPHFLYNTLENLLFLVEEVETDRAINMIVSLSHFFRFITNRSDFLITLDEEISFSKSYIEIMKARFDNFNVIWNIKVVNTQHLVLKLLLQPIIENCIHHGVKHSDKLVNIQIDINENQEELEIKIKDDAIGIDKNTLDYLKSGLVESRFNRSGIFNVNDRLKLYYHDKAAFEIESELHQGTIVTIKIPKINRLSEEKSL